MRDMPALATLAARRPHGDRIRYMGGCRCSECRRANTDYEKRRAAARKAGDWNGLVSAASARQHIESLSAAGVGYKQVADAASVSRSLAALVRSGERLNIRALTERAILAVTAEAAADHALIDAGPTWHLLDELIASGYSKASIARQLGYENPALQIRRTQCTVRSAFEVRRVYEKLRRVPAIATLKLIAALRAEGYREKRIAAMVAELGARAGVVEPDLQVYRGFVSAQAAELVKKLHAELTAEPA